MRAEIDQSGCIGCGLCVSTCPEVFSLDDDQKAQVILSPLPDRLAECAQNAADSCPASVITVTD